MILLIPTVKGKIETLKTETQQLADNGKAKLDEVKNDINDAALNN